MLTATKVLFLNSEEEQIIEFLLPITNERHTVKVISKEFSFKDNKLIREDNKLPIVVGFKPSTKYAEMSCKRYFISRIIEKIKLYLIKKYSFYFSIKAVKELHLRINKTLDVFDKEQYTYQLSCSMLLEYNKQNKYYTEEFVFSSVSLLGDIVLFSTTTLPPLYWNVVKDLMHIPKNTVYYFNENIISFIINNIEYKFDIETKQLFN